MKFNKKIILLPLMIAGLTLTGCTGRNNPTAPTSPSQDYTYATKPEGEKAYKGHYYDGFDFDAVGSTLLYNIHKLMLDTHRTMIRYSQFSAYTKASTSPRSIDQSAENSNKNVMFYTGKLVDKSASYTREHVWPCANSGGMWVHDKDAGEHYVDGSTYVGGGSDLYHVRPSTSSVNTARGNSKFIEFGPNDTVYESGDGGPYKILIDTASGEFASKCEPPDAFKGDIARILLYVYVHYNKVGDYNNKYCGSLSLTHVIAAQTQEEAQEVLCKWNAIDPVDDTERLRNDTIEQIQGNRNIFVDHPELVAPMFGLF